MVISDDGGKDHPHMVAMYVFNSFFVALGVIHFLVHGTESFGIEVLEADEQVLAVSPCHGPKKLFVETNHVVHLRIPGEGDAPFFLVATERITDRKRVFAVDGEVVVDKGYGADESFFLSRDLVDHRYRADGIEA